MVYYSRGGDFPPVLLSIAVRLSPVALDSRMIYTEMEGRPVSLMGFYLKPSMEVGGGGASDRVYSSENDPRGARKGCACR